MKQKDLERDWNASKGFTGEARGTHLSVSAIWPAGRGPPESLSRLGRYLQSVHVFRALNGLAILASSLLLIRLAVS